MKHVFSGRCSIYTEKGQLILNLRSTGSYAGLFSDGSAHENVTYEERDGKLYVRAEQLQACMYNSSFSIDVPLDQVHPSHIHTKLVRKYWLFGPLVAKPWAKAGWQRHKDNLPVTYESNNYTIIR